MSKLRKIIDGIVMVLLAAMVCSGMLFLSVTFLFWTYNILIHGKPF